MEKILEMRRKRAALVEEARSILDKAEGEKRSLSEDEDTKYKSLVTEIETTKKAEDREMQLMGLEGEVRENAQSLKPEPEAKKDGFESLGEMMLAVRQASIPGGKMDNRLEKRTILGLNETVPSEGGFLVDKPLADELITRTYATGALASRCRKITIGSNANGVKINTIDETSRATGSRWGGVQAFWAAEGDAVTAKKPKFRQIELSLNKLMAIYYATEEELQDATVLTSVATQAFTEEMGFLLDDAIVRGSGAGQPLGVLNSGALLTVAKEGAQAADSLVFENIGKMWRAMPQRNRSNSVWFMNQELEFELSNMTIDVGTGGQAVFMPAGGISGNQFQTLYTRPIIPIEQASGAGDVGDIMLLDLSQYILAEKGGIQTASSIHVQFLTAQEVFRFIMRVDGQPIWNSAITPFKRTSSTFSMSPYITLAAR